MAFQKADAKCLVWGLSRKKENGHDRVMRIDKRTASTLVEIASGREIAPETGLFLVLTLRA